MTTVDSTVREQHLQNLVESIEQSIQQKRTILSFVNDEIKLLLEQLQLHEDELYNIKLENNPDDISLALLAKNECRPLVEAWRSLLLKYSLIDGGFSANTNQRIIEIVLTFNDCESNKRQIQGVKEILPYIKPFENLDGKHSTLNGCKVVSILSTYGTYYLYIRSDGTAFIVLYHEYGEIRSQQDFSNIDEALRYAQDHYWYRMNESD